MAIPWTASCATDGDFCHLARPVKTGAGNWPRLSVVRIARWPRRWCGRTGWWRVSDRGTGCPGADSPERQRREFVPPSTKVRMQARAQNLWQ